MRAPRTGFRRRRWPAGVARLGLLAAVLAGGCGDEKDLPTLPDPAQPDPLEPGENPIIRERFSSDPAALVHDGRVWLYTGHDEAPEWGNGFVMREWHLYSSDDMVEWVHHGVPVSVETFPWAISDAWASQAIERDGRFYFYATVRHATINGFAIGVAVADSPEGPFIDPRRSALVTNAMTAGPNGMDWDDIDPTVFIDDDGQAYLFWGNTVPRYAKLRDNMIELDGPIVDLDLPGFTEAPWVHQRDGTYYLSYGYGFPEQIAYATAPTITGPWTFEGVINDVVPGSPTNHQSIIEFQDEWYFFYHNAELPGGGEFRRSVAVERLFYDADGDIIPITQADFGLDVQPPAGATGDGP
ncbi:MAG: glycoside hydrolase family 43 protein, partial [Gemmatimonadota bacterium]